MQTSDEACRRSGLTYRQLDHWTRLGLLQPERASSGTGHARHWPEEEVQVARVFAALNRNAGMGPDKLADVATTVRRSVEQRFESAMLDLGQGVSVVVDLVAMA